MGDTNINEGRFLDTSLKRDITGKAGMTMTSVKNTRAPFTQQFQTVKVRAMENESAAAGGQGRGRGGAKWAARGNVSPGMGQICPLTVVVT